MCAGPAGSTGDATAALMLLWVRVAAIGVFSLPSQQLVARNPVETINLQFRKRILQALEGIPTPAGQIEFLLTHVDLASPMPLPTGIPVDTSSRGIVSVRFLTKSSVLLRLLLFFLPKLAFFASGE